MELLFKEYFDDSWKVIQLYHSGNPIEEIEKITKKSRKTIYEILKKHNSGPSRIQKTHTGVTTLHQHGMTPNQISSLTGYSTRHIRRIIGNSSK